MTERDRQTGQTIKHTVRKHRDIQTHTDTYIQTIAETYKHKYRHIGIQTC